MRKVSALIDWQRLTAVPDPVRSRLRRPVVIVDATIVECTAPAVSVSERLSTDPNARWIKKGGHCRFGCQGFVTSRGWILERTFGPLIRRLGATRSWFMGCWSVVVETVFKTMAQLCSRRTAGLAWPLPEGRSLSRLCPMRRIGA